MLASLVRFKTKLLFVRKCHNDAHFQKMANKFAFSLT